MLIDTTTNGAALLEMLAAIRNEDTRGFAGVGVSRPLGYPDWRGLIGALANETRTHCGNTVTVEGEALSVDDVEGFGDLLLSAKIFKATLGPRYFEVMRSLFGPRGPLSGLLMRYLAELPLEPTILNVLIPEQTGYDSLTGPSKRPL